MAKPQIIAEGATKKLSTVADEKFCSMEFTDTVQTPTGRRKASVEGKGEICASICLKLFSYLSGYNIPTHFEEAKGPNSLLVRRLEMVPLVVHVRNVAAADLCERFEVAEGTVLDYPVIEFYRKHAQGQMVMVNDSHCLAFKLATVEEMRTMHRIASKANAILRSFFDRRGLLLVELRLEFGKSGSSLIIGDEISPDTCRIWDRKTRKKLDFDSQKQGTAIFEETYRSLQERVIA